MRIATNIPYRITSLPRLGEPRRALHDDDHELVLRAHARGAQRLRVVPQNIPAAHEADALRLAVVVLRHERPQLPDGARLWDEKTVPVTRGEIVVLLRVIGEALVVEKGYFSPPNQWLALPKSGRTCSSPDKKRI